MPPESPRPSPLFSRSIFLAPREITLKLGEIVGARRATAICGGTGAAGANSTLEFCARQAKLVIYVSGVLGNQTCRVIDDVTCCWGNGKTLAADDLCDWIVGPPPAHLRRVCGLWYSPVNPASNCWWRGSWTDRLAVDVKYSEGETEVLRVEVEVTKDWVVPGAIGLSGVWPSRVVVFDRGKTWKRFALRWSADIGVCRRILLPITTNLRWCADCTGRATPKIVGG